MFTYLFHSYIFLVIIWHCRLLLLLIGAIECWNDDLGGVYKQKNERLIRELELVKAKLVQQHEDDLEQMVSMKKQMEKKLSDAYEEVDEQRQVVAQWKRKSQRLAAELNDSRLLYEEKTNRNNILEKKQRKCVSSPS